MKRTAFLSAAIVLLCAIPAQACDFACTTQQYLKAWQSKDAAKLDALLLPKGAPRLGHANLPYLTLPNGQASKKPDEYRSQLRTLLQTGKWTLKQQVEKSFVNGSFGGLTVLGEFKPAKGKPIKFRQNLIFSQLQNGWVISGEQFSTL